MRRASLAGIVQKFSRASRIGKFSFAPALFSGKLCEIDQCFVRQACDPKSLEYRRKHIYPNGIRTSGSFPAAPQCFPVLAKAFASLVFPASGAPSCSALEPAATIDFLRDPLAFHWAIPCAFSIFARSFLRLRWGLACPKGDYAWRNMTWQLLAADPAVMSRRFGPAASD